MKSKKFFFENLIKWDRNNNTRDMPWKGERDPYRIWISEIILQQTRVQQGLHYYQRFIKKWPDVKSLAAAGEQQVYKAWEGLGYYSRCRNLISSARYIADELDGKFPDNFDDILTLKGIGNYTAAAIASFAFNQPHAVVDGNVFRVLSRFFGINTPLDSAAGKNQFTQLANELLDKENPGAYNQAIMDFGAVVCKPTAPLCKECVLRTKCVAFNKQLVLTLPVKEKAIRQRIRFFNYFIIEINDKLYVHKRTQKDIWQNLYEFALIETQNTVPEKRFLQTDKVIALIGNNYVVTKISKDFQQKLTHQTIHGRFFHVALKEEIISLKKFKKVSQSQLRKLPFPKFITSYLRD